MFYFALTFNVHFRSKLSNVSETPLSTSVFSKKSWLLSSYEPNYELGCVLFGSW